MRRGRPLYNNDNVALLDEMNTEFHRMACFILCVFQKDEIGCFDRMIPNHSMLNIRKFGVLEQVCKLHSKTLNNTKYYIKTALGTSTTSNSYRKASKIYGYKQETGGHDITKKKQQRV